jgi:hypothetical protein
MRHRHLRSGNNAVQAPPGVPIRPGLVTTAPSGTPTTQDVGKIVYEPTTGVYVANADEWTLVGGVSATNFSLGPWFDDDLSGTATVELKLVYANSATPDLNFGTTGASSENEFVMAEDGAVIGAFLLTDTARTAGTAILKVRLNSVTTDFAGGACVLDGTDTLRNSAFDNAGVAFVAGDRIGVDVVTSGWTPTNANLTAFLVLRYDLRSIGSGSDPGITLEEALDAVGAALVAGNNIDITVNDPADTITIDVETLTLADISDVTSSPAELNVLDGIPGTLTATEIGYVDGVTSAIQTQLDARVDTTGNESIDGVKTFTSDPIIPDEAYGAGWNGVLEPPTKNAVYDKLEAGVSAAPAGADTHVQFNDGGALAGEAGMTYNKTTDTLTLVGDVVVADDAYAVGWNGNFEVPTKNAVYDKIETISAGSTIAIKEENVAVLSASTLDFDGSDFNVTDQTGGEGLIQLAYGTGAGTPAEGNHTHLLAAGATDVTSSAAELNILDGATLTVTELNYVDGVTSAIQTQLDATVKDTGDETIAGVKTFSSDPIIPDEAYDATAWNGSLEPPTKNAVRDKIETLSGGSPGGATTQVQYNNASAFDGAALLTISSAEAVVFGAGTTSANTHPKFTSSSKLTTPEEGAMEFADSALYFTGNTTSDRGIIPAYHEFRLTSDGSNIGAAIADFFGANSSINLPASSMWYLEAHLFFLKNTAGTLVVTVTNSAANYTSFSGWIEYCATNAVGSNVAPVRNQVHKSTTAATAFLASASLGSGVNFLVKLGAVIQMNAAGNLRIRCTESAGTITPQANSFYRLRRMPGNTGDFVA